MHAPTPPGITDWSALHALRWRYHEQDRDRWTSSEVDQLRFLRWLGETGRLVEEGACGGGQSWDNGVMNRQIHVHLAGLDGLLAPLPVGTLAPDFKMPQPAHAAQAKATKSSSRNRLRPMGRGQALVLVFYPMDWEPVSREQLTLYQAYADTFAGLGARLLGISCDHAYSHEAFARDAQLRFPLLADFYPHGQVARQYGVLREAQGVSARALFILDTQRVIRFSKAYPDQLNPGVDELLTTLEALVAGEGPGVERRNEPTSEH